MRMPHPRSAVPFLLSSVLASGGCTGPASPGPGAILSPGPSPAAEEAGTETGPTGDLQVLEAPVTFTVLSDSVPADPETEALLSPYRSQLRERTEEVIGRAAVLLSKAQPEGTLGNFAADAMLRAARERVAEPVHMALTNNGGLRVSIPPGPITVGRIYELMPFENRLSILVLSGEQVLELAHQVAAVGGEPIAGFSFRIHRGAEVPRARDVTVGGKPVEPGARYRLVTNDYLASGGGNLTPLHHPLAREDLPLLLRDAFMEYVREEGVVQPTLEGRIEGGVGSS